MPDLHDASDYWKFPRPLGTLIFEIGSAELHQQIRDKSQITLDKYYFEISESQKSQILKKTRADESLKSVFFLNNLGYWVSLFQKT